MREVRRWIASGLVCLGVVTALQAAEPVAAPWTKLLVDGMVEGAKGIAEAKQAHGVLRKDKRTQAKGDYGLGLVYVRQHKYREAQGAFADAREAEVLPGAWEGEIWCRLAQKDLKTAYPLMEAYTRLLVHEAAPIPAEERTRAAMWLGSTFGGLEQTLDNTRAKELHETQTRLVVSILGDPHKGAFEQGRTGNKPADEAVPAPADTVESPQPDAPPAAESDTAKKPEGSLKSKREQEEAARVEKTQKKSEVARDNVKKSAEQWKLWYDDNIAKVDITLTQLVQQSTGLQARMNQVQNDYQQVKQRESQLSRLNPKPGSSAFAEMENLSNRAGQLVGEGQQLSIDLGNVQRQGAAALQQRAAIVRTFEQATGQLVKQDANLKKIQEKLAEKKGEGVKPEGGAKLAKGPAGAKSAAKKEKAPAFKDLVPFDVEGRRNTLLATLGLAVPPAAP